MAREPILMAVAGRKGVGKTFTTIKFIRNYVKVAPKRKALIFDVNNEFADKTKFPDIRAISLANMMEWCRNPYSIEIRRIAPFYDDGRKMTLDDMAQVLMWIVRNFYGGLLLIEDLNKYVADSMPGDLIGAICTNRHAGLDIILHYQSIGRLSPKVWQNINHIRLHRNTDAVDRHRNKFEDKFEYLKIAELIIREQFKSGNERYFLHIDFDNEKIHSGLSEEVNREAINEYVSTYYSQVVSPYMNRRDNVGTKLFTPEQAYQAAKEDLYIEYFTIKKTE